MFQSICIIIVLFGTTIAVLGFTAICLFCTITALGIALKLFFGIHLLMMLVISAAMLNMVVPIFKEAFE